LNQEVNIVLDITDLTELNQPYQVGFKQCPMSINNEVTMQWIPIYKNPTYWSEEKLAREHSMFSNVGIVFDNTNVQDQSLFLNCLDGDSEYFYKILVPSINQLQTTQESYSKIQNLLVNINRITTTTLLEFLKQFTTQHNFFRISWRSAIPQRCARDIFTIAKVSKKTRHTMWGFAFN